MSAEIKFARIFLYKLMHVVLCSCRTINARLMVRGVFGDKAVRLPKTKSVAPTTFGDEIVFGMTPQFLAVS